MPYTIGRTNETITVPKGFVTDFASIPPKLAALGLSPHKQHSRAAVVHDYLYWAQGCSKAQADRLLVIAMRESNVGWFDEVAIFVGVDGPGWIAWNQNADQKKAKLPRVVPEKYLRRDDPNMNWPNYRKFLVAKGVVDPPFEKNPSYCALGNSTAVPH